VLAKWFEGAKPRYRAPEYRKVAYLKLQPADIADVASVTDDQIREDFEKRKDSYRTPETRTDRTADLPEQGPGHRGRNALKTGTTLRPAGNRPGQDGKRRLLGEFTKDKVPDQAVADAAFAVAKTGGTTPVVDGTFGPVILRITNIKPESTKTLDEVKEEIRKQLAVSNASQE
jgi:peptidyl-prolyl cis-trans isomerase D